MCVQTHDSPTPRRSYSHLHTPSHCCMSAHSSRHTQGHAHELGLVTILSGVHSHHPILAQSLHRTPVCSQVHRPYGLCSKA